MNHMIRHHVKFQLSQVYKKLMVFDNPFVRWLATRRKDSMYALACKLNIHCDLLVASQSLECGSVLRGLLSVMSSRF